MRKAPGSGAEPKQEVVNDYLAHLKKNALQVLRREPESTNLLLHHQSYLQVWEQVPLRAHPSRHWPIVRIFVCRTWCDKKTKFRETKSTATVSRAGLDFNCRLGTRSDRIGDGLWRWWWIGFLLAVVFGDLVRRRSKTISAQQPKKILLFLDAHEKGAICLQWRGHCFRDLRYLANEIERGLESHSIDIPTRMLV